jgi:Transcription factor WhiB
MTAVLTEAPVTFPADWAERANCRSLGLNHFFEDLRIERRGDPYAKARQACNGCDRDVRNACLASAIAEGLRTGFFAGAIPARRLELRRAAQGEGVDVAYAPSLFRYFHRTLA